MLKELRISNIILIESAEIHFQRGLNVITGETGSGKSAIMHALSLITGVRADSSIIRKGEEKGAVEAFFEGVVKGPLRDILEEAGIACDQVDDLVIRREVFSNGKSRAYVNNQMVQIAFLKSVGEWIVEIVSQHASRHLLSLEAHRSIIDLYGNLESDVQEFALSWEHQNDLQKRLTALVNSESQRIREMDGYSRELEELQEAALKEGEDEELFAEYSRLMSSEELSNKSEALLQMLNGEKYSALSHLNRQKGVFDDLVAIDGSLASARDAYAAAVIELQEVAYTLSAYHHRIESNPALCQRLNDRLTLISQMKRKYGSTIADIQQYQQSITQKLDELENRDADIEKLKEELAIYENRNQKLANVLTIKRKKAASDFSKEIVKQLISLNMPKVEFEVEVIPQKRSRMGDDLVEFFLLPNVGEHRIPIKECASGGELSRVLLALHVVLAGKQQTPTLVFDEIDEGVGGQTATLMGERLREIGDQHQVLCITHFSQVAKHASFHIQISKSEQAGRTATKIQVLNEKSRDQELSRMIGA